MKIFDRIIVKTEIDDWNWIKYDSEIISFFEKYIPQICQYTDLIKILNNNIVIEISLLLTNNSKIRKLNKDYRNKDKATNILSFPCCNLKLDDDYSQFLFDDLLLLGDIVISFETIIKEVKKYDKDFHHHLLHLTLHSILHLIGYDHINESDAKIMEEMEINILKKFNIQNPYFINEILPF